MEDVVLHGVGVHVLEYFCPKGRTIRKVMGGVGKKAKNNHARENGKKKNSYKEEGKEKNSRRRKVQLCLLFSI